MPCYFLYFFEIHASQPGVYCCRCWVKSKCLTLEKITNIYMKSIIVAYINKKVINYLSASQLDVWISATSVYHGNTSKDNKRVFFLYIYIKTRFERRNTKKKYQIQKEKFCNLHVMITVYFIWGWKENNLRMFTSVQYIWGRLWTSDHTHTDIFYFLQTASFHFRPIPRYRQIFAKDKLNFFFWVFFFRSLSSSWW